jgi:myo-inositol-1(or 4)-monophosphatase
MAKSASYAQLQVKRSFRASLAYRLHLVVEERFDGMLTLHDSWE